MWRCDLSPRSAPRYAMARSPQWKESSRHFQSKHSYSIWIGFIFGTYHIPTLGKKDLTFSHFIDINIDSIREDSCVWKLNESLLPTNGLIYNLQIIQRIIIGNYKRINKYVDSIFFFLIQSNLRRSAASIGLDRPSISEMKRVIKL